MTTNTWGCRHCGDFYSGTFNKGENDKCPHCGFFQSIPYEEQVHSCLNSQDIIHLENKFTLNDIPIGDIEILETFVRRKGDGMEKTVEDIKQLLEEIEKNTLKHEETGKIIYFERVEDTKESIVMEFERLHGEIDNLINLSETISLVRKEKELIRQENEKLKALIQKNTN